MGGRAERCLQQMASAGLQPDMKIHSSVIVAYARCNDTEAAVRLLDQMQGLGMSPDEVPFNAVLDAAAKHRDMDRLRQVCERMKAAGVELNTFSYTCLARPHAYAGRVAEVQCLAQQMEDSGLK